MLQIMSTPCFRFVRNWVCFIIHTNNVQTLHVLTHQYTKSKRVQTLSIPYYITNKVNSRGYQIKYLNKSLMSKMYMYETHENENNSSRVNWKEGITAARLIFILLLTTIIFFFTWFVISVWIKPSNFTTIWLKSINSF